MLKGKIIEVREDGTAIIQADISTIDLVKRQAKECYVEYIDSRSLSAEQRKMCYALIHAISDWSGNSTHDIKEAFKFEFMSERVESIGDKVFSLSNAPMSLVAEFQKFLIAFIIENGIPVKRPLIEYCEDIEHYVYMCLIHKKCAVCGKKAELHHVDRIGMGNDRTEVIHEGRKALPLCREHHREVDNLGDTAFYEKYHLIDGIEIDKTIMKIYGLKR